MFRKEEAAVTDWSPETVEMCANRQREILRSAADLVRPGGCLVYSTCTFAPAENEENITAFLQEQPAFSVQTVQAPWFTPAGCGQFRLWPHKLQGEGHFVAVLRKQGGDCRERVDPTGEKLPKEWEAFAKELQIALPAGKAIWFGQNLYWAPKEMPQLRSFKVLRPGLALGEVKKGRFEPDHALALWLKECKNMHHCSADSAETAAYMHGEVIPANERGWCLVTVDGYSIGWGKGDGAVLKNHYPKGLRR